MPTDSDDVRSIFLDYFSSNDHRRISGSSVLADNDPTLLFVNSGMAPLKRYFTGEEQPPARDLCNVQPCIRTRDIEDVGDRHHLTFFEMLGSWSIGGYFKDRAVELAMDLLITGFRIDPERLYVTVFAGDDAMGMPADEESAAAWERVGMRRDHIVPQPAADNFWGPAGDTGPCGPCTEVFLDTGDPYGPPYVPGGAFDTRRRYIEMWNAGVFMQFDRRPDGTFAPLPFHSVDTGSGLERVTLAMNRMDSVYDTDLLRPVVTPVSAALGDASSDLRSSRIIADHIRATVVILSEGIVPSNEGAGYVPRRLLRRSLTLAFAAGQSHFDYAPVVEAVVDRLGGYYPLLRTRANSILAMIAREYREFESTIHRAVERLDEIIDAKHTVDGAAAFQLFTTYGLPPELTKELAAKRGARVSLADYDAEFRRHQARSRTHAGRSKEYLGRSDALPVALSALPATEFLGYDTESETARSLALLVEGAPVDRAREGEKATLIVDRTPFFGEGGGQVGDQGDLDADGVHARVIDTQVHASGRYLHSIVLTRGELCTGQSVRLTVDSASRAATAANHSATHLLSAALRTVLGEDVHQAGSLVDAGRLRFDFTHSGPVSSEKLREVERLVNTWIARGDDRRTEVMTSDEASRSGAVMLAGEQYGSRVRVVTFGDVSSELCGGTHVATTADLLLFRILGEEGVAGGIRRITAVTRQAAVNYSLEQADALRAVLRELRVSQRDAVEAVRRLAVSASIKRPIDAPATILSSINIETESAEYTLAHAHGTPSGLRSGAEQIARDKKRLAVVVADTHGAATVTVAVPDELRGATHAGALLKAIVAPFAGSGGGNERLAQGKIGATLPDDEALVRAIRDALA